MTGKRVIECKTPADVPALAIGGRFDKFRPEEEKAVRTTNVVESKALRQMKAAWKACGYDANEYYDKNYPTMLQTLRNLHCTAKDVEEFSLALSEFQQEKEFIWKAGLFLSALINSSIESDYVIHTEHLVTLPYFLGYENQKNIIINGNVGYGVGYNMEGGSIAVNGNACNDIGREMKGGSIAVNGNAEDWIGKGMQDGSITVEGNVGVGVGREMKGGV
jgi:hypothetical protein